ncbi:MAG: hypothetical protein PWP23_108 [Candidatus Sumerlaeota bacterium]|nr:hypothetical protein [Candidatus Sumerlaeota bacterium]
MHEYFLPIAAFIGLGMLIWDCVEVGRNDAANLINAVFGARALKRNTAILIAGISVILGATFAAPVMETARKGIFNPALMTFQMAMTIYISVYFVDTVLLYGFSAFGMPVSTTACLVFELVGAAWFLAGPENVHWPKVGEVTLGIIVSIIIAGVASFMVMRVFRGIVRDKAQDRETVMTHGPWIAGLILMGLAWFMIFKGLKNVALVGDLKLQVFDAFGVPFTLLLLWAGFTLLVHMVLVFTGERGCKYLFHVMAVMGMICLAFAFGQNDLANCASPGLSALSLWQNVDGKSLTDIAGIQAKVPIAMWMLFVCGVLMAGGMFTNYSQRVTRAAVNTGSQFDQVDLYAPNWCKALARIFVRVRGSSHPPALAPEPGRDERGKKIHFDTVRAAVITGTSAAVIAFASGRGLPVSTTYVSFAAILGTGLSDRVFATRGDAELKIGRAIWVIACWFIAPLIAIVATGLIARLVYHLTLAGLVLGIAINLAVRFIIKRRSDAHEDLYHLHHGVKENVDGSPLEADAEMQDK